VSLRSIVIFVSLPAVLGAQQIDVHTMQSSLNRGLRGSQASAIVVDVSSGKLLAGYRLSAATPQEPGSTLKPLVAAVALKAGTVTEHSSAECHGTLTIGNHNLRCSHPRAITIFDLQHAIAYSCNDWFAQLAQHMPSAQLTEGLRSYGLSPALLSGTAAQRQLLALGLESIRVTPLQLAGAYRDLALQFKDKQSSSVQAGLLDSVDYGMAHNAAVKGIMLAGKTGTAADANTSATHGFFAGILYSPATQQPAAVIVIFLPQANGGDAAALAQRCLLAWSGRK